MLESEHPPHWVQCPNVVKTHLQRKCEEKGWIEKSTAGANPADMMLTGSIKTTCDGQLLSKSCVRNCSRGHHFPADMHCCYSKSSDASKEFVALFVLKVWGKRVWLFRNLKPSTRKLDRQNSKWRYADPRGYFVICLYTNRIFSLFFLFSAQLPEQQHPFPSRLHSVGSWLIFQQDNEPKHTSRPRKGCLTKESDSMLA